MLHLLLKYIMVRRWGGWTGIAWEGCTGRIRVMWTNGATRNWTEGPNVDCNEGVQVGWTIEQKRIVLVEK